MLGIVKKKQTNKKQNLSELRSVNSEFVDSELKILMEFHFLFVEFKLPCLQFRPFTDRKLGTS